MPERRDHHIERAVADCLRLYSHETSPAASIISHGSKLVQEGWNDGDIQRVIVRAVRQIRRQRRIAG